MDIIYKGVVFKKYDNIHYVSSDGKVYSSRKKDLMKTEKDIDGYTRITFGKKHFKIHKLVYLLWGPPLKEGEQVNHIDDNKENNSIQNLYAGTQKRNIEDCEKNGHRVGNVKAITLLDKKHNKIITFPSVRHFIEYDGHSNRSGSFSKAKNKIWFKERYEIISIESVTTKERYTELKQQFKLDENKAEK